VNQERIDYQAERKLFIAVKRARSTRGAYSSALRLFGEWLDRNALDLGNVTPGRAADFIRDLKVEGWKDSAGAGHECTAGRLRLTVTACSSFYTHLESRFDGIRNPFHGLPAAPEASSVRATPAR
jgi:hypothetical protein